MRGATGGGGYVRLNAGGTFFAEALPLKGKGLLKGLSADMGRSNVSSVDIMLLDVGGVPRGSLLLTGVVKRTRGATGGSVRLYARGIFRSAPVVVLLDIGGVPGGSADF